MRNLLLATGALAALVTVSACNKKGDAPNADPGTSNAAVNAAQDATSAAVGATSAATLGANSTDAFVMNAAMGDMYEIEAGKLAQTMGKSKAVKDFGASMVKDHTAMADKFKTTLAGSGANLSAPTGLDERRQGLIDNLRTAGDNFDKVYADQQVAAHKEMLTLLQGYADNGDNTALKSFAAGGAPKVAEHLKHAEGLQSGVIR